MDYNHDIIDDILDDIINNIINNVINAIKKYKIMNDIICYFKGPTLLGTPEKSPDV
jgi:hypothetical protein